MAGAPWEVSSTPPSGLPSRPIDPFDGAPELIVRPSLDQPFLGSAQVTDPAGGLRARYLRDGAGLRVFLMNFVLEDSAGRALYRLRQPPPKPGLHRLGAWSVLDSTGSVIGSIDRRVGLANFHLNLRTTAGPGLTARISTFSWKGFDVLQGTLAVGTVRLESWTLWPRAHLTFSGEAVLAVPRALVVLFVAYASSFALQRGPP
ncbi:MAG: hypothetical protein L3K23_02960 [Thermoplasmata archaeon]|nr:hypothetical protein [Thermoplasmata archaeon]